MTPGTLMLWSGIAFVVGLVIVIVNFAGIIGDRKLSGGGVFVHLFVGAITGCGFLGLVGGFVWFLIDKFTK